MADAVPVILADVVGSRRVADFRASRDALLKALSSAHRERGWIRYDYAVTAGDEFQSVATTPTAIPELIFDMRRRGHPLELWIAIGVGAAESLPRGAEPVNVAGTGQAFERAREAMSYLRASRTGRPQPEPTELSRKYRFLTAMRSGDAAVDDTVNIIYRLLDSLLQRTTERQWQTISAYEERRRLDAAAAELGIDESTASRNLARAAYWQSRDAVAALEKILRNAFP